MKFFSTNRGKETALMALTFILVISTLIVSNTGFTGLVTQGTIDLNLYNIDEEFKQSSIKEVQISNVTSIRLKGVFEGDEGDKVSVSIRTSNNEVFLVDEAILREDDVLVSPITARVTDAPSTEETEEEPSEELDDEIENNDSEDLDETDEETHEDEAYDDAYDTDDVEEDDADETSEETHEEEIKDDIEEDLGEEVEDVVEEIEDVVEEVEEDFLLFVFDNTCKETCVLDDADVVEVIINVTGGTFLLEGFSYASNQEFLGEGIKKEVGDITLNIGEEVTLLASEFFEGEDLVFDAKSSEGYTFVVVGDEITFTGAKEGAWSSLLYALEDSHLIISNAFDVIVTLDEQEEIIDEPTDEPTDEPIDEPVDEPIDEPEIPRNETQENLTTPPTPDNETIVNDTKTIDCSHPNPNMRPLECILHENTSYFHEERISVENKNAVLVGEFTIIGNLKIRGDYVEQSSETPNDFDYQAGYIGDDGFFIPTIWINTETGDLHLRGNLTEANSNIVSREGMTTITNKRGIILAVIDRFTGDMILRGNIIPFRRTLE